MYTIEQGKLGSRQLRTAEPSQSLYLAITSSYHAVELQKRWYKGRQIPALAVIVERAHEVPTTKTRLWRCRIRLSLNDHIVKLGTLLPLTLNFLDDRPEIPDILLETHK
jgi:hypothetical protein